MTLSNLVVTECEAKVGAGVCASNSELAMSSCDIYENEAEICGGGLFLDSCSDAQVTDSTIANNTAGIKPAVDDKTEDGKDQAAPEGGSIMDQLETGRPRTNTPPPGGSIMDQLETGRPSAPTSHLKWGGQSEVLSVAQRYWFIRSSLKLLDNPGDNGGWPNEYMNQSIGAGLIPVDEKELFSGVNFGRLLLESYTPMPTGMMNQPVIYERDLLTPSDAPQIDGDPSLGELTMDKFIFTGGGITLVGCDGIRFDRVRLKENSARRGGGGLSLFNSDNAVISDGKVTGNTAGENGGGISMGESHGIKVTGTIFEGNTAGLSGGAFFQHSHFLPLPEGAFWGEIKGSTFTKNSAPYGAALEGSVSRWRFLHNVVRINKAGPYVALTRASDNSKTTVPITFHDNSIVSLSSTSSKIAPGASWVLATGNTFEGNVVNGGSVLRLAVTDKSHQHNISLKDNVFRNDKVENGAVVAADEGWKLVAADGKEYDCTQCMKGDWRRQKLTGRGSTQGIDGAITITSSGEPNVSWAMLYVGMRGEMEASPYACLRRRMHSQRGRAHPTATSKKRPK